MDAAEGVALRRKQALENGGMLRIHGKDGRVMLLRKAHDHGTGSDKRLLVGQGDDLAGLDGGYGRRQAAEAYHGGHYDIDVVPRYKVTGRLYAGEYLDAVGLQGVGHLAVMRLVADDNAVGVELPRLGDEQFSTIVGCKKLYLKEIRVLAHHVECLSPYRSGRSEYSYPPLHQKTMYLAGSTTSPRYHNSKRRCSSPSTEPPTRAIGVPEDTRSPVL